jgi:hypothetical protein
MTSHLIGYVSGYRNTANGPVRVCHCAVMSARQMAEELAAMVAYYSLNDSLVTVVFEPF